MAEFFKNNQIALRHCLFYEFLQGKSAEKAFVDVSQTVGKNVMNKEEIQILFRRFAKGKFYKNSKKHDQLTAKDIIRSDKKALCTCIFYLSRKSQKKTEENRYLLHSMNSMSWREKQNVFRFNPSFVMYEEFRIVIGEDVMEFKEFDFRFYRFLNGDYDLNFERDENKKVYELLDMPIDIMRNIVEYLNIFDRLSLEKTSQSLRLFSQNQKIFQGDLTLEICYDSISINFNGLVQISYKNQGNDCVMEFRNRKKVLREEQMEDARNFTPLLHVKHLILVAFYMDALLHILPSLKPGYLTTITINIDLDEHFHEFTAMRQELFIDDVREIKEILLKSPDFEKCNLVFRKIDDRMTEFLKNNPMALRHCLLYLFVQEKSVDIAFDDFCKTVGPDVIRKEAFQHWFDEFEQGKFDDEKQPINDMRDILRGDKNALRVCVFYESLKYKHADFKRNDKFIHHPVFSLYMHFCEVIGEDVMEYREFDFWFYRFANGLFDLKFERNKNEKLIELSDMPLDVMVNIVEYLDIIDRLSLERTSQSLRSFSQDQKVFHPILKLDCYSVSVCIAFGKQDQIDYENCGNDCVMTYGDNSEVLHGVSFLKQALRDFKKILENPKLYINTLIIKSWCEDSELFRRCIEDALKFTHLLHVQHLSFSTFNMKALLNILPSLTPEYLTTITIYINSEEAVIGKIVEMEQWKQAQYLYMNYHLFVGPLRHLSHFHKFTVAREELFIDDVREMKEILFDSPDFEGCILWVNIPFENSDDPMFIRRGKFDDNNEPVTDMRDVFRNDKHALRVCVMYEWLSAIQYLEETKQFFIKPRQLPVFTGYINFCKVIGDGAMEFSDFDFWFYRFANGEFNLNFERDKDRKIYELMDMPIDIMRNIVEYLDIVDRVSLDGTSQSLRLFSQDQKVFHLFLELDVFDNSVRIGLGEKDKINYEKKGNDCVMKFRDRETVLRDVSNLKKALQDFKKILENPKLYVNTLGIISFYKDSELFGRCIEDALKFTHLLHVQHLSLYTESMKALLNILRSLKPGYLTTITIHMNLDEDTVGELIEMDQWEQSKYFHMRSHQFIGSLRHLYHFKEFHVVYRNLLVNDARGIKESLLKSPDFEKCTLYLRGSVDPISIMQVFGEPIEGSSSICVFRRISFRMAEFLKNDPIALRHCLLYIFLQQKSIEKPFEDFCETVGPGVIKKKEFQFWFAVFEQGIVYLDEQPVADISEFIRNDKHALRVCVMYEWLSAKRDLEKTKQFFIKTRPLPVFIRYMHFCEVIGDGAMEFSDFDFWFYRFANGEFNLNFERDKELKIYELMDMPFDIMRNIVEYLDIPNRMSLERTSQSLRLFSQDQKLFHPYLKLDVYDDGGCIDYGKEDQIEYKKKKNDCVKKYRSRVRVLRGVSYMKKAFQDFKKILENPKLYVNTLTITSLCEDSELFGKCIEDALKFTHLLHVKHLILSGYSRKALLNTLPSLKPGYLTTVTLNIDLDKAAIEKIVEMEQWKQAKYFIMGFKGFVGPLRHLYHFKQFTVGREELFIDNVREIKELLLKSPDFEKCNLRFPVRFPMFNDETIPIMQVFGGPIKGSSKICHYQIPNSTEYFEIIVSYDVLTIERKKS
ncbi:unnamed protein product [Caenorhabditis brenneri]